MARDRAVGPHGCHHLLRNDHKAVKRLFRQFEKAGDAAHVTKRRLVDDMIRELAIHAAIEENLFYPTVREFVPETEDNVLESLEEHHIVKWTLSELEKMDLDHERFDAKVTVLIESVEHHATEEEEEFFPKVRKGMGRKALDELGTRMEKAKKAAPTRPHPKAPDEPPGSIVAGIVAAIADKAKGALQRAS